MRNRKGEEKKNQIKIRKTRPTEIDVGRRSALTCMRWSTLDDAYKIYYTSPSIYILFGHWQLPPTPLVIPPYAQQFLRISTKNWGVASILLYSAVENIRTSNGPRCCAAIHNNVQQPSVHCQSWSA
jgi:hypothetical protein